MFKKDEIDSALLQYLLDELNPGERQAVENWISQSAENRLYFESFRKAHIYLQCSLRQKHIRGTYEHWQQKKRRRLFFRRLQRIAAILVLGMGLGVGVYMLRPAQVERLAQATPEKVAPGSAKAVLYLSSGRCIQVDSCQQEILESDGMAIYVTGGGALNYLQETDTAFAGELTNKLAIPRGGEFQLTLNDGTKVWLNSETELEYPTQFNRKERVVYLKGEAYFDVAQMTDCPFIVKTGDMQVKVYGTQFNVNTHVHGKIETVLVKGRVGLSTARNAEIFLKPGQKADYQVESGQVGVENTNVLLYTAWKNGYFMFRNENLDEIMDKLSRWYDLEVFYLHSNLKEIRLSGMMERYHDVRELFRYFEKISDVRFEVRGKTVTVK